jgi:hypothetical protein
MRIINLLTALTLAGIWAGNVAAEFQGAQNTFYGVNAGINTAGDDDVNTFIGADAGFTNTTGAFNTFLGADVGYTNSTGSHNTFVGTAAGAANSTGSDNSFFGSLSGFNNTGSDNTFLGANAGWGNQTGSYNLFLGSSAGYSNTTGASNTFLGTMAGLVNTTGSNNIFLGFQAGFNNTIGNGNTFVGRSAGSANTVGAFNTFLGNSAGAFSVGGEANTFLGNGAGSRNNGSYNTFLGNSAGSLNTSGSWNTFIGNLAGAGNTSGRLNTFLGQSAGSNSTGSSNVFLGYNAGHSETGSHKLYIDNSSTSSPLIYGDFATNALTFNGSVNVTGSLTKGSGTFVQPHPVDPSKEVAYAFFEGPEHAIFLRGKAKLVKGRATITTPEYFRVVAGKDEDITVQFTPRSIDTFGVAAVQVSKDSIEVRELKGGKHSYEFDYFITAKRGGFEGHQPIQANTHFTANEKTAEDFEQTYTKTDDLTINALRQLLIANGTLTKDGKLNPTTAAKLGWNVQPRRLATTEPQMTTEK